MLGDQLLFDGANDFKVVLNGIEIEERCAEFV